MKQQSYDIIGDIHGHADELLSLLDQLGYQDGRHPDGRKVIFLGDLIDRGPKIRRTLEIVKGMAERGNALVILGNHEVNAIRCHTKGKNGDFLRPHTPANEHQHRATLDQFPDAAEWQKWINWFAGLPLSLDLGGLRAVHACWDAEAIRRLTGIGRLEGATLEAYSQKNTVPYEMISLILNGPEATFPNGFRQRTADGVLRSEFRVKWWMNLDGLNCRSAIFPEANDIPRCPL